MTFCCAGATAELVSLQHWMTDAGYCCKIEAFLPVSTQSDMGRLSPIIQGVANLPGPFVTVDRAGDLVAAGTPIQDALGDMGAFNSLETLPLRCRQPLWRHPCLAAAHRHC